MKEELMYIQLPPLPEDLESSFVGLLWNFAKLNKQEQKDALQQIEGMLDDADNDEKGYKMMKEMVEKHGNAEENPELLQYMESMRKLVVQLIGEACEMAFFLYQKYYIEKMDMEDIMKISGVPEYIFHLFSKHFE